ncbi:signal peptide, CUB and EGF-like domain-containing protein 2 [Limulus polyphemus]|uniref:Signal peptide, CUB and EGF-like domain-containing protein 2 n=1 Tax=Limulus polyphemus TaxID=6850 RepID=A0ABM1BB92_LIMPO|nr:signal peptide, CUB and EGF-like domain-containing protein 2 [Limulus polyphemus]
MFLVLECQDLHGLKNGERNCADWIFGKICSPTCQPGYVFYTAVSDTYECSLNGEWTPSNIILDCSAFIPKTEGECPAGTESKHDPENGEICVECPPGYFWQSNSAVCNICPTGEYQDEFRQVACKKCPMDKNILLKLSPTAQLSCEKV